MAHQKRSKEDDQRKNGNEPRLGFEEKLWLAADRARRRRG